MLIFLALGEISRSCQFWQSSLVDSAGWSAECLSRPPRCRAPRKTMPESDCEKARDRNLAPINGSSELGLVHMRLQHEFQHLIDNSLQWNHRQGERQERRSDDDRQADEGIFPEGHKAHRAHIFIDIP